MERFLLAAAVLNLVVLGLDLLFNVVAGLLALR